MPTMASHGCNHYLQDKALCHTSKRSMAIIKDHRIELIVWPGNVPDLNQIENIWMVIKMKLMDYKIDKRDLLMLDQ